MRSLPVAVVLLVSLMAACGQLPASPPAASGGTATPSSLASPAGPVGAADVDGPFRLELAMPRAAWSSAETIEAQATLRYLLPAAVELGGSGSGLLAFSATEMGGTRRMEAAWQSDCTRWTLAGGAPLTSGLVKSGGWSADDPNAAFYEAFFADPEYRLPAGRWLITALAVFAEGPDCGGAQHTLQVSQEITVTD